MDKQARLKKYVTRTAGPTTEGVFEVFQAASEEDDVPRLLETTPFAKNDEERGAALAAHAKLMNNERLDERELGMYEAIVVPTGRPALLVADGSFGSPLDPWKWLGEGSTKARLESAIRAVGRVELHGPTSIPYAGTAFVVGNGLLMTNRHVANLFSRGRGLTARFLDGFGAAINFTREKEREGSELPVARVVLVHPVWDVALLAVEGLTVEPLVLDPIAPAVCKGNAVVLIGYPARDGRSDLAIQDRVFDGTFGVKRLQPGFVLGESEFRSAGRSVSTLAHDASTLGGNSGSSVVDVASGRVLGLHFAGEYLVANYAVPAHELSRDDVVREAGVKFASGAAEPLNPWEGDWSGTRAAESTAAVLPKAGSIPARVRSAPSKAAGGTAQEVRISIPIEIRLRVESS